MHCQDYLYHPELLKELGQETEQGFEDGGQWFYEGRGGWWQYDERTSQEIEGAWSAQAQRCELLIAGFLYIVDFEQMLQFRRNDPSRRRRIKRDQATGPKKGIAGLRMGEEPAADATTDAASNSDDAPTTAETPADAADDDGTGEAQDLATDITNALENLAVNSTDQEEEEEEI